jgi:hypothetical protein
MKPLTDSEIIKLHGGTTKVGKLVGLSPQTVHHWYTRGIPYKYKVKRPDLFMPEWVALLSPPKSG